MLFLKPAASKNRFIAGLSAAANTTRLGTPSAQLLTDLAALREAHLDAVDDVVQAILNGTLSQYLGPQFRCTNGGMAQASGRGRAATIR